MELRTSLHPGPFLKAMVKWTETPRNLHKLLRLKRPDTRMGDVELVVRYLGFRRMSGNYRGNLKAFLDVVSAKFNEQYADETFRESVENDLQTMENAIALDMDIFNGRACRKWKGGGYDSRFNRAVFDVQIASLSDPRVQQWLASTADNKRHFEGAFVELSDRDARFVDSVETTTKSLTAVKKRFEAWFAKVRQVSGVQLDPPVIADEAPH